jgi:hypothetical protein
MVAVLGGCSVRATTDPVCIDCEPIGPAFETDIETGALLDTELGFGAGLFVEYESGGLWRLWTSCDSLESAHLCEWDVFALSESFIEDVVEIDTEGGDDVDFVSDFEIRFFADTSVDSDTVEILTEPGAWLEIDPFLDGFSAPDFVVWSESGAVIHGAPRAPVVFFPDAP